MKRRRGGYNDAAAQDNPEEPQAGPSAGKRIKREQAQAPLRLIYLLLSILRLISFPNLYVQMTEMKNKKDLIKELPMFT